MSQRLPTGIVTFLFTDIESSTLMWEEDPVGMEARVAEHDAKVAQVVEECGGHVILERGEGDAHFCVFERASDAIFAAAYIHSSLAGQPDSTIRVRIGIHSGEAQNRSGTYFGPHVIRAARIRAVAHGGQTIVSSLAANLAKPALRGRVMLTDLGNHRLKDLQEPERLFQVDLPGKAQSFPPLRSLDRTLHNLPYQSTDFVGREQDLAAVVSAISDRRLVTLTGTGGAGKTRLSLQVGAEIAESFPDGVWFVDLTSSFDIASALHSAANALSIQDLQGDVESALSGYLAERRLLLILDNCEHLVKPLAKWVANLLRSCPNLKVLCTSRQILRLNGEYICRVPSLSFPQNDEELENSDLRSYEAIQLFLARAEEAGPMADWSPEELRDIARICQRLDGLPLAIELAAAKTRLLNPGQILARLNERFKILVGGDDSAPSRYQTMRAAIDHSYQLLNDDEKVLFRGLSIFPATWSLEAAESIFGDQVDVVGTVQSLFDKSLIARSISGTVSRYRLLESIREFALELSEGLEERSELVERHSRYYESLAQSLARRFLSEESQEAVEDYQRDLPNLRVALNYALEHGEAAAAAEFAYNLHRFWLQGFAIAEARAAYSKVLPRLAQSDGEVFARSMNVAGVLENYALKYASAKQHLEASLDAWRQLGNEEREASVLNNLGLLAAETGDSVTARRMLELAVNIYEGRGGTDHVKALMNLGVWYMDNEFYPEAIEFFDRSQSLLGMEGDVFTLGTLYSNIALASVLAKQEDVDMRLTDAIQFFQAHDEPTTVSRIILAAALRALQKGKRKDASTLLKAHEKADVLSGGNRDAIQPITRIATTILKREADHSDSVDLSVQDALAASNEVAKFQQQLP